MRFIYFAFIFVMFSHSVSARWETIEEASCIIESDNHDFEIHADGTGMQTHECQKRITNENALDDLNLWFKLYNKDSEDLEIILAKSISPDGQEHIISKDKFEISDLPSGNLGHTNQARLSFFFENLQVGSKIYVKYKVTDKKSPFVGKYYFGMNFGEYFPVENSRVNINSAIYLYKEVGDPDGHLDITESNDNGKYTFSLTLKKPIYKRSNEVGIMPKKFSTYIQFSSDKSYAESGSLYAQECEGVLNAELPPFYQEILNEAQKEKTSEDKINKITSMLAKKINYLFDLRTVESGKLPRPFAKVCSTGQGDCKDYSAATVAILRKMGFNANCAMVGRGVELFELKTSLPMPTMFNHFIAHAIDPDGKVFWIDATNSTSMADGIYPDIENRPAFVLDLQNPRLDFIPAINPDHAKTHHEMVVTLVGETGAKVEGKVTKQGESALSHTGSSRKKSKQQIEDDFFAYVASGNSVHDQSLLIPDLTSRVVSPICFEYSYVQDDKMSITSIGPAFPIECMWCNLFLGINDKNVLTTYLDFPENLRVKRTLKNFHMNNPESLNATINNKWIDAKREVLQVGDDLIIDDVVVFKTSIVTGDDLRTPEFAEMKKILKRKFKAVHIIDEKGE